jgi:hypothetical protein
LSHFSSSLLFSLLLALEVFSGIHAALVFRVFPPAKAGYLAGTVFLSVGIIALWLFRMRAEKWRRPTLFVVSVYLFLFALPLWVARLLAPSSEPLQDVFGLPLDVFHQGSQISFATVFLMTVLQLGYSLKKKATAVDNRDSLPPHR